MKVFVVRYPGTVVSPDRGSDPQQLDWMGSAASPVQAAIHATLRTHGGRFPLDCEDLAVYDQDGNAGIIVTRGERLDALRTMPGDSEEGSSSREALDTLRRLAKELCEVVPDPEVLDDAGVLLLQRRGALERALGITGQQTLDLRGEPDETTEAQT